MILQNSFSRSILGWMVKMGKFRDCEMEIEDKISKFSMLKNLRNPLREHVMKICHRGHPLVKRVINGHSTASGVNTNG